MRSSIYISLILMLFWSCGNEASPEDPANPVVLNYELNGSLPINAVSGNIIGGATNLDFNSTISTNSGGTINFPNIIAGSYDWHINAYSDSLVTDSTTLRYQASGTFTVVEDITNTFQLDLEPVDGAVDIEVEFGQSKGGQE